MWSPGRNTVLAATLMAGLLGSIGAGIAPQPFARAAEADARRLQGVTFDVATRTERVERPALAPTRFPRLGETSGARVLPEHRMRLGKVFGSDDRVPVDETDVYPWSTVAKVFSRFPDGTRFEGSASVVGDRYVMTAGHIVYDADHGGWAEEVEVVPGFHLGFEPFGSYFAEQIRSFVGWTQDRDFDFDIAMLEMDGAIGDATGWLGIAARSDTYVFDSQLHTAGYPGDLEDGEGMWYASGFADSLSEGRIFFSGTLDAAGGQSGSALWIREDDERFVVGVVSSETSRNNAAARISGEVFDVVDSWLDGFDGPADLNVSFVGTDLPRSADVGAAGVLQVDVENLGARDADALVEVFAEDRTGLRNLLVADVFAVPADGLAEIDFEVVLPMTLRSGEYVLVAVVNRDGAVPESDLSNNELDGPALQVLVPESEVALRGSTRVRIAPGGEARYRFVVDREVRALKLKVSNLKGGSATVRSPSGETFVLRVNARRSKKIRFPELGEWNVVLTNPVTAVRTRSAKFKARLSRR